MKSLAFTKTYGTRQVLNVPALNFETREITAVIGANGSGKSTLGRILAGVETADQKKPVLNRVSVGYLPQKPFAFRMRLEQNLLLNGSDRQRAETLLEALGLMPLRKNRAHRLSGGETAKMALARLFMADYDMLILDEPTAAMDMESTIAAERLILEYREKTECAVLLITHSLQQAQRLSDRTIYLEQGRLIEQGAAAEMLRSPKEIGTKRFLEFYGNG